MARAVARRALLACGLAVLLAPGASFGAPALDATAHPNAAATPVRGTVGPSSSSQTVTTPSFSTGGACILYAFNTWVSDGACFPTPSDGVTGAGLTWTRVRAVPLTGTWANTAGTEVWKATSTGALTNVTVTGKRADTSSGGGAIAVYCVTGASSAAGVDAGNETGDTSASAAVTLTGTTAGSLLLVGGEVGRTGTITAQSGTTLDWQADGHFARNYAGRVPSSAGGTVSLGSSTASAFSCGVAIEALAASGTNYNDTASEAASPADSLATTVTWSSSAIEAASPADSLSTSVAWANAVTETATALDALATTAVWPAALVEALTAAAEVTDQLNGGGTNYVEAVTEALTELEAMGAVVSMPVAIGEAAAPGDALAVGNDAAAGVTEALVPLDGYAVTVLRQAVVNEALAAQESLATAAAYAATLTEAAAAEDAIAAQAQLVDTIAEPVGLLDVVTGGTVDLTHAPRLLVLVRRPELALVVERPAVAARVTRPTLRVRFSR